MIKKGILYFIIFSIIICILAPVSLGAVSFSGDDKIIIVLDPGHGSFAGSNNNEGVYNLKMAQYIKNKLDANGSFSVYLTRDETTDDISHYERVQIADSLNADIMISVHFNSSESKDLRGMEAWASVIDKYDLSALAGMCTEYATAGLPQILNRGVFRRPDASSYYWDEKYQWDIQTEEYDGVLSDYYGIITWGLKFGVPTFILEEMYLSNEEDLALANDDSVLRKIGDAQANAIIDYYTGHTHDYSGAYKTDYPASCISRGKQSQHCSICSHRKNVGVITSEINKDAHFMRVLEHADATCGKDGYTIWSCVYTDSLRNKAGIDCEAHGETTVIKAPEHEYSIVDCEQAFPGHDGYAVYKCGICGNTNRITFSYGSAYCSENGHVYYPDRDISDTQATCTEGGESHFFCLVCGEDHVETTEALGHDLVTKSIVSATCNTDGYKMERCSKCGEEKRTTLSAIGHVYETKVIVAPDCTHSGLAQEVCRLCESEGETSELSAIGHIYDNGVETEKASAFSDGEMAYTCTVCGNLYTEPIPRTSPLSKTSAVVISIVLTVIAASVVIFIVYHRRKNDTPDNKTKKNPPEEQIIPEKVTPLVAEKKDKVKIPLRSEAEPETEQKVEFKIKPEVERKIEPPKVKPKIELKVEPEIKPNVKRGKKLVGATKVDNKILETVVKNQEEKKDDEFEKSVVHLLKTRIDNSGSKIDKKI